MIDAQKGQYYAECDECGDTHDLEASTFEEAVAELKRATWVIRMVRGVWQHICAGCARDLAKQKVQHG